jgi:hypothetical protein
LVSSAPSGVLPLKVERPEEEELFRLADQIPGFGGIFVDDQGDLVVHLTDLRNEAAAKGILASTLARQAASDRRNSKRSAEVVVRQGRFEFRQLAAWRDRMTFSVLDLPGVVLTDLNERRNRLVVGIEDEAARARVEEVLAGLGVPLGAVEIEVRSPFVGDANMVRSSSFSSFCSGTDLSSCVRPLAGGFALTFYSSGGSRLGGCTLGLVADWNGRRVLVTNSHCSVSEWGGPDGARYYQPNRFSSTTTPDTGFIGTEIHDPRGATCGFLGTSKCRYSDANIVSIGNDIASDVGYIARTNWWGYGRGSVGDVFIDPANPRFRITTTGSSSVQGTLLDKMGAATGWTYGELYESCADVKRDWHIRLCQGTARYGSNSGDSGAPVFRWNYDDTVSLFGVHWGSSSDGSLAVYSPIWGLNRDLGTLNVYAP